MSTRDRRSSYADDIRLARQQHTVDPDCWSVHAAGDLDPEGWVRVSHSGVVLPEQGWKLHVSAAVFTAPTVLRQVLPVLFRSLTVFKVAASPESLGRLNDGTRGLSQVGKFITVYPVDDDHAVHLAAALDTATTGLRGPAIPSDRAFRTGSIVHSRYGGFGGLTFQTRTGEVVRAIRSPDGELVPDLRRGSFSPPDWVTDPFHSAGATERPSSRSLVIGERFLLTGLLRRSARGCVYVAVDLERNRPCVVKQARAGSFQLPDGSDARALLRHECDVLRALAPDRRFPRILDLVEEDDGCYLVMNDVAAKSLQDHVLPLRCRGRTVPMGQVVRWGRCLTAMLEQVHAAGFIYQDLKSTNVLVRPDDELGLVDFECAYPPDQSSVLPGAGTRGYVSPGQRAGEAPEIADDIYGLGALLLYLSTGVEPSLIADPDRLLARPLHLLNPAIAPELVTVIHHCLAPDPVDRFRTVAAVDRALASVDATSARPAPPRQGHALSYRSEDEVRTRYRRLAHRVGDTLCSAARRDPESGTAWWISRHPLSAGVPTRDVNTGVAGTVLALAELVADLEDPAHREILSAGAAWLLQSPPPGREQLPGLYVGEAGTAAAVLRAGQVLADPRLVGIAVDRGRWIASLPHDSPDLFNGTAGRLRFHLLLWDETGSIDHLTAAVAAGERLVTTACTVGTNESCWPIPPGYGALSGNAYLGYAHGAAGVADALLDLYEVTGEARYLGAARAAAHWLERLAIPALDDGSGLNWPSRAGAEPAAPYWCHGAAGIGRFWLHAARLDVLENARDIARRSVLTTARGSRWAGPTLCHGLSGSIELLLDAYQDDLDMSHLAEARSFGRLLEPLAVEIGAGLAWSSESPYVISPDYNVGYAGLADVLLRLAEPEKRPHGLGRAAFRPGNRCHQ
ncbi:MAG: hypothetical protein GEU78_14125 [Actinobacteria bacterium]|nr:hypothetical protein [Actinomycetota bacterium]